LAESRQWREDQSQVMPIFEVQDAQGKTYEVDAPDIMTAGKAFQGYKPPSAAEDAYNSFDSGVAKGSSYLLGSLGDLSNLGARGIGAATNFVERKLGMPETPMPDLSKGALASIPTSESMLREIKNRNYGGEELYKPQRPAGKFTHSIGEMAPAAALGPGGVIGRTLTAIGSGIGGEGARQATEGTAYEPYAQILGTFAGGMAPNALGRAITPLPASPARQRLVDVLHDEGVTSLTAGQRTGSPSLRYAESVLGDGPGAGGGATRIQSEGQQQFTEAAMRRAGRGLEDATPETLAANNQRLGNQFEQLSARNTLTPDNQFITDLTTAVRDYRNVPNSQQRAIVQGYVDDIVQHVNQGSMPGVQYQEMRSRLSRQSNSLRNTDPTLSDALRDMRNALDNAMERSIPAGSPDAALWRQSRQEYGAQKTIEKTASRAGEATAEGQIVPANLRNTVSAENRGAYARGEGNFSELARAGAGVMAPLPNSGTAQRNLLTDFAKLPFTAPGGRLLMSAPAQGWLGNQLLAPALRDNQTSQRALFNALMETSRLKLSDKSR
jgi:hypothetical protein